MTARISAPTIPAMMARDEAPPPRPAPPPPPNDGPLPPPPPLPPPKVDPPPPPPILGVEPLVPVFKSGGLNWPRSPEFDLPHCSRSFQPPFFSSGISSNNPLPLSFFRDETRS